VWVRFPPPAPFPKQSRGFDGAAIGRRGWAPSIVPVLSLCLSRACRSQRAGRLIHYDHCIGSTSDRIRQPVKYAKVATPRSASGSAFRIASNCSRLGPSLRKEVDRRSLAQDNDGRRVREGRRWSESCVTRTSNCTVHPYNVHRALLLRHTIQYLDCAPRS
jgi:hypothetical protein